MKMIMQLTEHFSLNELTASSKAKELGVDNAPNDVEKGHLRLLCTFMLEPIRIAWGSGIKVSSGFRCEEVNAAANGSATSAHRLAYAADIVPSNGKMKEFKQFVKKWCKQHDFDQCIDEKKGNSEWMHVGLMNGRGEMRRQFLKTTDGKTYTMDKV